MDLTEVHQAQISRFVGFFKSKKETMVRDRQALDDDYNSDHLSDDTKIWNNEQVMEVISNNQRQAKQSLDEDLEKIAKLAAVYCTELMRAGQAMGVNLQAQDISVVEDQNRIDQVNALSALGRAPPAAPKQMLPTIGGPARGSDPGLLRQLEDAQEESRKANERYEMMQKQVTSLLKERSDLSAQLDAMRQEFAGLRQSMQASNADAASQQRAAEMEQRLYQNQVVIQNKNAEVEAMRRDLEARLGDSSQFRQLKTIIKEKNSQLKTLRSQLQQLGYAVDGGGEDLAADSD
jgi:leucine zipper transcription factor-like protein 1